MKTGAKIAVLAATGFGLWYYLRKSKAVNNLRYSIVGVTPSFSGLNGTLTIQMRIDNPSLEVIPVDAIAGGVTMGDFFLGTASVTIPQGVPAGGSIVVPVTLVMGVTSMAQIVLEYLTKKGIEKPDLIYNGNISIKGINFPFNLVYKIPML